MADGYEADDDRPSIPTIITNHGKSQKSHSTLLDQWIISVPLFWQFSDILIVLMQFVIFQMDSIHDTHLHAHVFVVKNKVLWIQQCIFVLWIHTRFYGFNSVHLFFESTQGFMDSTVYICSLNPHKVLWIQQCTFVLWIHTRLYGFNSVHLFFESTQGFMDSTVYICSLNAHKVLKIQQCTFVLWIHTRF